MTTTDQPQTTMHEKNLFKIFTNDEREVKFTIESRRRTKLTPDKE